MQLGETVISKRTGLPQTGAVVAFVHPAWYLVKHGAAADHARWDELYPDWRRAPVVFVRVRAPTKNQSPAEYAADGGDPAGYAALPDVVDLAYPYEDLEVLE